MCFPPWVASVGRFGLAGRSRRRKNFLTQSRKAAKEKRMEEQLKLIVEQGEDYSVTLFGDGVQVAGSNGQTQQRTYVEQVQYWAEFTVMWLWHNDRLQSVRSQERYFDVWLDFFGYDPAGRFEAMPFETENERARRIANVIDASPVKPWNVDARAANAYKVRLENRRPAGGKSSASGSGARCCRPTPKRTRRSARSRSRMRSRCCRRITPRRPPTRSIRAASRRCCSIGSIHLR